MPELDFNKISEPPETNRLSLENSDIILERPELKVVAENQYYSAARAIEMIDLLKSKLRDIRSESTIKQIKNRMLAYAPLDEEQRAAEYADYIDEMNTLELSPVLDYDTFLYYRDYANIDNIIPAVLEEMGLEYTLSEEDYEEE